MRGVLILVLGCCLAANASAAEKKNKKRASAKASAAAKVVKTPATTKHEPAREAEPASAAESLGAPLQNEAKQASARVSPSAPKHVAVLAVPAAAGVEQEAIDLAARIVETELQKQGFAVIGSSEVEEAHEKRGFKVPTCGDVPGCLANAGVMSGASYVANVSVGAAGKQYGFKLTVVDAIDSKTVSNKMSLVSKLEESVLTSEVKKQVARTATTLHKYIASRPPAPEPKPPPGPEPAASPEPPPMVAMSSPSLPSVPVITPPRVAPEPGLEAKVSKGSGPVPWLLMGAGAVGVGVGVGLFGTQARSAADDFRAGRDPEASRDSAKSKALLADISSGVGIALMATGGAILLFSGSDEEAPVKSWAVTPAGSGLAVSGSF